VRLTKGKMPSIKAFPYPLCTLLDKEGFFIRKHRHNNKKIEEEKK
jgi:hypothetical protein